MNGSPIYEVYYDYAGNKVTDMWYNKLFSICVHSNRW
jgi:hypothetical protein